MCLVVAFVEVAARIWPAGVLVLALAIVALDVGAAMVDAPQGAVAAMEREPVAGRESIAADQPVVVAD